MVMARSLPCLLVAALACSDSTAPAPGNPLPAGNLPLTLAPVAAGLDFPLDLTAPPSDARLFVVEKTGRIRLVKNGASRASSVSPSIPRTGPTDASS